MSDSRFSHQTTVVSAIRELIGHDAVLLPIPRGQKAPKIVGWQQRTIKDMGKEDYLSRLAKGNIGVLLGSPSSGLCSIDIDDDCSLPEFLDLNPVLKNTLQTRGARGANLWVKIKGDFPKLSPLVFNDRCSDDGDALKWGEWRADGGQTVIHGKHPSGCDYRIACPKCGSVIYSRRHATCGNCGEKLPADLLLTKEQIAALDEQMKLEAERAKNLQLGGDMSGSDITTV
jgi:hypothetical protein